MQKEANRISEKSLGIEKMISSQRFGPASSDVFQCAFRVQRTFQARNVFRRLLDVRIFEDRFLFFLSPVYIPFKPRGPKALEAQPEYAFPFVPGIDQNRTGFMLGSGRLKGKRGKNFIIARRNKTRGSFLKLVVRDGKREIRKDSGQLRHQVVITAHFPTAPSRPT